MTNFESYIKQDSKLNRIILIVPFLCFIILLFHPLILSKMTRPLSTILLTIGAIEAFALFAIIIFLRNSNFLDGIVTNGTIEFHERHINLNGQSFKYSDLKDLYIFYAGYPKSKKQIHVYRAGNYLKFTLNETPYKIYFLIKNELERQKLVALLKTFNELGIKYTETTSWGNSYFLDINLKYAEIQDWKNRYLS